MKLRKLARLCEHDELKAHTLGLVERDVLGVDGTIGLGSEEVVCPGGVFLPDDTLVIEKDDDLVDLVIDILSVLDPSSLRKSAHAILDALIVHGKTP